MMLKQQNPTTTIATRPRPQVAKTRHVCVKAAAPAAPPAAAAAAVDTLKRGALKPGSVPAPAMLSAMLDLEKARLSPDGWLSHIEARGARWRLVFTSDSKQVQAAAKRQPNKGGIFFPIAACQRFEGGVFENGVFLGPLASLTFSGPYKMEPGSRQISFDVVRMDIGIGPWRFGVPLKKGTQAPGDMADGERKKLPFFLYAYADDDIVVARGRSGGLAVWVKASQQWLMDSGVARVYK